MYKLLAGLFLLILINIFGIKAFAQANVSLTDVVKIHLIDGAGYMTGYDRNEYDVLLENGQWKSYQTREEFNGYNFNARDRKRVWEHRDSSEHKFIKWIARDSIKLFLKALAIIKPKFIPSDLNVSIPQLTQQIDTTYFKNEDKKKVQLFNSFFNTPAKLNHILDIMQDESWSDDSPYAVIEIFKKDGDTIKVITDRQVDFMLPWKINHVPSYDIKINEFFMNATGLKNHRMSGQYLKERVKEDVYSQYADDAFERLRWQEIAPENVKFIQHHFDIMQIGNVNGSSLGSTLLFITRRGGSNDESFFAFHPQYLNAHVVINGYLNIADNAELTRITNFAEDTVAKFLKTGGFMIDSCQTKPGCTINFYKDSGKSIYHVSGSEVYLKNYKPQDLFGFSIRSGKWNEDDHWFSLPDGKFMLATFVNHYVVGVSPQYFIKDGVQMRKFVFMMFTKDGKWIPNTGN